MSKQALARSITLAVLGASLAAVAWRKQEPSAPKPTPDAPAVAQDSSVQDAIYAMFDAAKEGRVPAYLGAYTGNLRSSLEQSLQDQGPEKFAAYLTEQTGAVKGLALAEPQRPTETQARIQVEYVYQDRNETQWLTLDKTGDGWKISRIEAAERIRTLVPYGTPVN